jgi:hypothetical protein
MYDLGQATAYVMLTAADLGRRARIAAIRLSMFGLERGLREAWLRLL